MLFLVHSALLGVSVGGTPSVLEEGAESLSAWVRGNEREQSSSGRWDREVAAGKMFSRPLGGGEGDPSMGSRKRQDSWMTEGFKVLRHPPG